VILRPCDWHPASFRKLLAAPTDGKPVTKFADRDDAFLEIAKAIRAATTQGASPAPPARAPKPAPAGLAAGTGPRSSNLRTRKTFTERDQDRFLDESFNLCVSGAHWENTA